MYMKSSFPKDNLRTWHWDGKSCFWNGAHHVLEKGSSKRSIYIHIHEYVYIHI